jgi:ribonuclease P protein component
MRVFRVGSRATAGGITVIALPGEEGPAAVGIVASRSVGNAVARNRARRRLREALAEALPPRDTDLIVVATSEVLDVPFGRLVEWVQAALPEEDDR